MIICVCCNGRWKELVALIKLATPSIAINFLEMSIMLVDLIMLGHLGKGDLAGAAVAFAYFNMVWFFIEGVLTAQDTLCAAAFVMRDFDSLRYWTYVSACIVTVLSAIGTVAFIFAPVVIKVMFGLNDRTAFKAAQQILISIPNLWLLSWFRVIQKYLQAQNIMMPAVFVSIFGVATNIIGNCIFMYGFKLKFVGAAISTLITRLLMLAGMGWYVYKHPDYESMLRESRKIMGDMKELSHVYSAGSPTLMRMLACIYGTGRPKRPKHKKTSENAKNGSKNKHSFSELKETDEIGDPGDATNIELTSTDATQLTDIDLQDDDDRDDSTVGLLSKSDRISLKELFVGSCRFLSIGLPGGVMLFLECWSLDLSTVVVAHMGNIALDAHEIMIITTTACHISIVFAISVAGAVRVASLLGAQQPYLAKTAAWLSVYMTCVVIAIFATVIYFGSDVIGFVFTSDTAVISRMRGIAPVVALFQVSYGLQGSLQGCLRGMGRQLALAGYNFFAFWIIGVPAGVYLALVCRPRMGLEGFWYGFLIGSGLLSVFLLVVLLYVDWEKEVRRILLRASRRRRNESDVISLPRPGSLAIGSVPISHVMGEDEAREIEEIEVVELGLRPALGPPTPDTFSSLHSGI